MGQAEGPILVTKRKKNIISVQLLILKVRVLERKPGLDIIGLDLSIRFVLEWW